MSKPDPKFILIEQVIWKEVGRAMADAVKDRMRSSGRWVKTGALINSITTVDRKDHQLVVANTDRLGHDKVQEMFEEEILKSYLEPEVQKQIARAVFNAFHPNGAK